ncbi:MAG: rhodanese-like domain-containing protein [Alphaproteobacteria bacterium]
MSLDDVHKAAAARADPHSGYAGEVLPEEAWRLLRDDPHAVLVDVRTQPEWAFVGITDLSEAGKQPVFVSWQAFPAMNENPNFSAELATRGVTPDATVIFMCRSGQRSAQAARAMTLKGFTRCYNMAEGFEGPLDGDRHRGALGGWKAKGLPWAQG